MHVNETGRFFEVSFDYDKKMVNAIKKIPGRIYIAARKLWLVPIEQRSMMEIFVDKYNHHQRLTAPVQIGNIPDLPYLTELIPLKQPMYPFQERGVAFNLLHRQTIIGDEMGLGKSVQAIATIIAANAFPALIICPATVKRNWQDEWMKFGGRTAMILDDKNKNTWWKHLTRSRLDIFNDHYCDVFITNFESVQKFFLSHTTNNPGEALMVKHLVFNEQLDLIKSVVVDEIHRLKNRKAMITKVAVGACRRKKWVMGLSGSIVTNKTEDLITQLCIINRIEEFGGIKYFEERYCHSNTFHAELNYKLRTTCFYKRFKRDVLPELPDKIRQKVLCEITTRKEYDAAMSDLANYLKEYQGRSETQVRKSLRGEIMVQIQVCKKISAMGKLNEVKESIEELFEAGEKVVVFVFHKALRDKIVELYPQALTISGQDSPDERADNVKAFNTHPLRNIIVCNIKAGGVGINLVAASNVLMVELPWHAADCDQCEDRVHRMPQRKQVYGRYFLGYKTIDMHIYELIEEKRALGNYITGGEDVTEEEIIDKLTNSLFSGMTM